MKTLDADKPDIVTTVFDSFFILLNQAILSFMGFFVTIEGKTSWVSLPFIALFVGLNGSAFLTWRRKGLSNAFKFYATANLRCFLALAIIGILLTLLAQG